MNVQTPYPLGRGRDIARLGLTPKLEMTGLVGGVLESEDPVDALLKSGVFDRESLGKRACAVSMKEATNFRRLRLCRALALMECSLEQRGKVAQVYVVKGLPGAPKGRGWVEAHASWMLSEDNLADLFGDQLAQLDPEMGYKAIRQRWLCASRWAAKINAQRSPDARQVNLPPGYSLAVALVSLGHYLAFSVDGDRLKTWPLFGLPSSHIENLRKSLLADLHSGDGKDSLWNKTPTLNRVKHVEMDLKTPSAVMPVDIPDAAGRPLSDIEEQWLSEGEHSDMPPDGFLSRVGGWFNRKASDGDSEDTGVATILRSLTMRSASDAISSIDDTPRRRDKNATPSSGRHER